MSLSSVLDSFSKDVEAEAKAETSSSTLDSVIDSAAGTLSGRAVNAPSIVRKSFLLYLKTGFPYQIDWVHPSTEESYSHSLIKKKLEAYKHLSPSGYKALYVLWTTQASRSFVADRLFRSGSTIRRIWDRSIDTILVLLLFPELDPEVIVYDFTD